MENRHLTHEPGMVVVCDTVDFLKKLIDIIPKGQVIRNINEEYFRLCRSVIRGQEIKLDQVLIAMMLSHY